MNVLIFLGIPIFVWVVFLLLSLGQVVEPEEERPTEAESPTESLPRFTRDYSGRLWVDRKQKGAFPILRRRGIRPPDDLEE